MIVPRLKTLENDDFYINDPSLRPQSGEEYRIGATLPEEKQRSQQQAQQQAQEALGSSDLHLVSAQPVSLLPQLTTSQI